MASSSGSAAKNFAAAAPAAAAAAWTPTGGRKITVIGPHLDTGMHHLYIHYDPRTGSKSSARKSITSLHADYPGCPSFLGCLPRNSWSTPAAAEAAIPHFRAWVDGGRRKQTTAANAARHPAVCDAEALPERFSKRRATRTRVGVDLNISNSGGLFSVVVALTTACFVPTMSEHIADWNARASGLQGAVVNQDLVFVGAFKRV